MPNPFRCQGSLVNTHPDTLLTRPALAVKIALIAAHWQWTEDLLGLVFAHLVGGASEAAMTTFHAIKSRDIRRDVLLAVAKDRLSEDMQARILVAFKEARRIANRRSEVVHASWATIESRPNSLLAYNPSVYAGQKALWMSGLAPLPRGESVIWEFAEFREQDMDDIVSSIKKHRETVHDLLRDVLISVYEASVQHPAPPTRQHLPSTASAVRCPQTSPEPLPSLPPQARPHQE